MTKYQEYYKKMRSENEAVFAQFAAVHASYELDKEKYEAEFHRLGQQVVDVIRDWERRLCASMGRGKYSNYTHTLAEKFWSVARKEFANIDMVGVRVRTVKVA